MGRYHKLKFIVLFTATTLQEERRVVSPRPLRTSYPKIPKVKSRTDLHVTKSRVRIGKENEGIEENEVALAGCPNSVCSLIRCH